MTTTSSISSFKYLDDAPRPAQAVADQRHDDRRAREGAGQVRVGPFFA